MLQHYNHNFLFAHALICNRNFETSVLADRATKQKRCILIPLVKDGFSTIWVNIKLKRSTETTKFFLLDLFLALEQGNCHTHHNIHLPKNRCGATPGEAPVQPDLAPPPLHYYLTLVPPGPL